MAFAMKVTSQVEAQRKILEEAVSTALMLASGKSDGAEVAVSKTTGISVSTRYGEVENVEFNSDGALGITVYHQNRKGSASSTDLSPQAIARTVQAALDIGEADMAYALVVDSIDYSIWVMFLLWAINLAPKFNKWVKADTTTLDEVSRRLEEDAKGNEDKASFVNLIFLLGLALVISAFGQDIGATLNSAMPFLDKATWTVLLITLSGLIGAVTPVGRMAGSTELSNLLLYSVVALLASRASFLELTDAPAWILAGFMILAIHGIILVLLAKIFHLDMFTCGVASLANIGGSASAPILAGAYSGALVPVGVLMALMGYVIGTAGGLITANIMSLLA